jgi:hypothetical protein
MSRYSRSGDRSKDNLLEAISGDDLNPLYRANSSTNPDSLSGSLCEMRNVSQGDLFNIQSMTL